MYYDNNWAVIIPMANESKDFPEFSEAIVKVLDRLTGGTVYFIVDNATKDNTFELCQELEGKDNRFKAVWAPENKNVVDAYMRGYREAYNNGHDLIIEMDAGLSHDPRALAMFLRVLNEGNTCAFGSRFINGGSMGDSPWNRRNLSKTGTV
ncbi:MAG TPA: glycosyltransferase, partial [Cytophagaceae bacterium]